VVTRWQPPAHPGRPGAGNLADSLIALAGTADDDSSVGALLEATAQCCADLVDAVAFASVTRHGESGYSTVAVSSALARAVDEAQYAEKAGPCLDALDSGAPTSVPHIDATMSWPGFRQAATKLGLRSSLSIPLFAGRGLTTAALNLYSHDPAAMASLSAVVLAVYDEAVGGAPTAAQAELCPGGRELITGLTGAFAVRATIQQALGMIIAERRTNADLAYALLRSQAATTTGSLIDAATEVVVAHGH
jgi:hypothetical protein